MLRLFCLAGIALCLLLPAAARAKDDFRGSALLSRMGYGNVAYEASRRGGVEGHGVVAHVEAMGTGFVSLFGNGIGLEADLDFGVTWPGAVIVGVGPDTMLVVESSLGFPFALVTVGMKDESPLGLRLQLAPGVGIGTLQAFAYLRARATVQVAQLVVVDLSYKWVPSRASHVWWAEEGLNSAYVRLAVGIGDEDGAFVLYGEVVQSRFEAMPNGPLGLFERTDYRNLLRFGAGVAF